MRYRYAQRVSPWDVSGNTCPCCTIKGSLLSGPPLEMIFARDRGNDPNRSKAVSPSCRRGSSRRMSDTHAFDSAAFTSSKDKSASYSICTGLQARFDGSLPVVFVDDVDRFVLAVGPCNAKEHRDPPHRAEPAFVGERSREDECSADEFVVLAGHLANAADVHLERLFDLRRQIDPGLSCGVAVGHAAASARVSSGSMSAPAISRELGGQSGMRTPQHSRSRQRIVHLVERLPFDRHDFVL